MKEAKKKLAIELIVAIEHTLAKQSQSITANMKKHVSDAGKKLSKKFFKTLKAVAKEAAKQNGKAKPKHKAASKKKKVATLKVAQSAKAKKNK